MHFLWPEFLWLLLLSFKTPTVSAGAPPAGAGAGH